jgi:hypothetical protein
LTTARREAFIDPHDGDLPAHAAANPRRLFRDLIEKMRWCSSRARSTRPTRSR